MKLSKLTAPMILYAIGTVVVSGVIVSAMYTADKRWTDWHASRLGEGGHLTSILFNITMFVAGILMFTLGHKLIEEARKFHDKKLNTTHAMNLITAAFMTISVCLIGVSLFPFDRFPVVHNSFGYGMTSVMLILLIFTPKYIPIFPKWFYRYGYMILTVAAVLFSIFFTFQPYTLLEVEIIMFIQIYIWLVIFVNGICRSAAKQLV